ncbi:stage II sporulation protein M [Haladaptatus salinisoli]|uniref:stage II sporulation protein M n=1 Tax=Haladaptatus salinisoli TaxID=2884876 RepID=UPI001D0AFD5F|nr:stage II sporulation protein M [Haladaptatus salinisoli]
MKFSDASSSVRSVLLARPAAVLPLYLAGTSVGLVAQTVPLVGVALVYALLFGSGRIEAVVTAVGRIDFSGAAMSDAQLERLGEAVAGLFTPEVVAVLLVSALLGVVVLFAARAVAGAAQVHAVTAALRDERAVASGVTGATEDWKRFLALGVARALAVLLITAPVAVFGFLTATGSAAAGLLLVLSMLVWLPLAFVVYLLFLFVPQAIVIDGVGVRGGIRRSAGFVRREPFRVAAYFVVVVGLVGMFGFASFFFQLLGIGRLLGVVLAFGLAPTLGVLKTALYLDEPPVASRERGSVRGALRRGLRELRSFLVGRPALVVVALALFAVGSAVGWFATRPFALESLGTDVSENVFGTAPVDVFVTLTANNWLVAISAAYAGLGFGVPTVVTLLFNGAVVGGVVGLLPDPRLGVALIAPHGVVEIPALAVAGGLGLHLGGVAWSYVRGSTAADGLAAELVRAYYVLLGLLPVFIVAAFIEAFLTWWIASAVA